MDFRTVGPGVLCVAFFTVLFRHKGQEGCILWEQRDL